MAPHAARQAVEALQRGQMFVIGGRGGREYTVIRNDASAPVILTQPTNGGQVHNRRTNKWRPAVERMPKDDLANDFVMNRACVLDKRATLAE